MHFLTTAVIIMAVSWILRLFIKGSKQPATKTSADGPFIMTMGTLVIRIGWGMTILPILIMGLFLLFHPLSTDPQFWADAQNNAKTNVEMSVCGAGFFSLLGIFLLWGSQGYVEISDQGIKYQRVWKPWRKNRLDEIPWSDVKELTFQSNCFFIYTKNDQKYGIPLGVTGIVDFLNYCNRNIPASLREKAILGYAILKVPFPEN